MTKRVSQYETGRFRSEVAGCSFTAPNLQLSTFNFQLRFQRFPNLQQLMDLRRLLTCPVTRWSWTGTRYPYLFAGFLIAADPFNLGFELFLEHRIIRLRDECIG